MDKLDDILDDALEEYESQNNAQPELVGLDGNVVPGEDAPQPGMPGDAAGAPGDFQAMLQQAMQAFQAEDGNPVAAPDPEAMAQLEAMFQNMMADPQAMVDQMMKAVMTKEHMEQPLVSIRAKYVAWLEENTAAGKVNAEQEAEYKEHIDLLDNCLESLRAGDNDTASAHFIELSQNRKLPDELGQELLASLVGGDVNNLDAMMMGMPGMGMPGMGMPGMGMPGMGMPGMGMPGMGMPGMGMPGMEGMGLPGLQIPEGATEEEAQAAVQQAVEQMMMGMNLPQFTDENGNPREPTEEELQAMGNPCQQQ